MKEELRASRLAKARATLAQVEADLGVPSVCILSESRQTDVVEARHEVMARLWRQGMTISAVANLLDVDHTTVIAGIRKCVGPDVYRAESAGQGRVTKRTRIG